MKSLSKISSSVSPSATLAVNALAKKMKADGMDVISFGAGEPDLTRPPRSVSQASKPSAKVRRAIRLLPERSLSGKPSASA